MIKGFCHTNLNEYRSQNWPKEFVDVPEIGSKIKSESGKTLIVCEITHCFRSEKHYDDGIPIEGEPYIEVELTKRTFA